MTPLAYLKLMLDYQDDFIVDYRRRSEKDRDDLKHWAEEEMEASDDDK